MSPIATANPARKSIPKSKRPLPKSKRIGLRIHADQDKAWDRLPFVGKDHGKHCSCWDVPMTGGFHGGIEVGRAMGRLYLKYVRDQRDNPMGFTSSLLNSMLTSLAAKKPLTEDEASSVSGQRVGFLSELSYWLDAAALQLGSSFDAISPQKFVEQANENLLRDDASLMAAIKARTAK
ncbi:hypothetical protein AB4P95_20200 [Pseudomonas sp. A1437]|uniref:hypothetical protein n=1 Tax=unclassified Pseudomonas TaxID=196821 RepID=UPI0037841932